MQESRAGDPALLVVAVELVEQGLAVHVAAGAELDLGSHGDVEAEPALGPFRPEVRGHEDRRARGVGVVDGERGIGHGRRRDRGDLLDLAVRSVGRTGLDGRHEDGAGGEEAKRRYRE